MKIVYTGTVEVQNIYGKEKKEEKNEKDDFVPGPGFPGFRIV